MAGKPGIAGRLGPGTTCSPGRTSPSGSPRLTFTGSVSGRIPSLARSPSGPACIKALTASRFVKSREWEEIQGHSWEGANTYAFPNQAGSFYVVQGPDLWRQLYPVTGTGDLVQILPAIGWPHGLAMDNRPNSTLLFAGTSAGELNYTLNPSAPQPAWNAVPGISLNEPITSIVFAPSTPGMAYLISQLGKVFRNASVSSPRNWTDMHSNWVGGFVIQLDE